MASTRDRILQTLRNHPRSTVAELAEAVNINTISVRHHIASLQAEGLLIGEEVRHGVGRPRLVYYLTDKGLEKFPSRYMKLTSRLLDQIKDTLPENQVNLLFTHMAADMADEYAPLASGKTTEERLQLVQTLLAEEGFTMDWEKRGEQIQINEVTCPYYQIGRSHPEVCSVDQTLISSILDIPIEKVKCILTGDSRCTYIIPSLPIQDSLS
jgi:DeoR family transcriptional regulator, suf operon transcriptional repressor